MGKLRSIQLAAGAALIGLCVLACSGEEPRDAEPVADAEETCQAMFVQSAAGMSFDGTKLTLEGANPNIIYFCDRPVREAGHLSWDALLELGASGDDSFEVDEPNAAVSVFGADGEVVQAVVTLSAMPSMSGDRAIYPITMFEGELPGVGGATVIFIDPIGRPRSPTSVAGSHRRHHRRAVRHHRR
jgi:hypothetical protein